MSATVEPTIVYKSKAPGGTDVLAVWPAIPNATENPAIQIDHGKKTYAIVEFRAEDAAALCAAIMEAAAASTLKRV